MLKFASFAVTSAVLVPRNASKATLRRLAHRHEFAYEPRPGFLYVRSRAISSRTNDNYDEFPAEEIKQAYATFVGKPVFVNHVNDNHRRARGVIIDAALHEDRLSDGSPDTWCEVLMEIDAVRFPKLAEAILAGKIDRTSMGCDVAYSICSMCGNKASTPAEYCSHIPRLKGKKVLKRNAASGRQEEHLIRETCYGLKFFENSVLVEPPADPTAHFLGVDSRGLQAAAKKTAAFGPHEISRAVDKASDELAAKHMDDLHFVPDWEPLRKALPASELNGWMFMNRHEHPDDHVANVAHDPALGKTWAEMEPYFRGPAHPQPKATMETPRGLVQYKHGITRQGLTLDENGQAWRAVRKEGYNGLDQGLALSGPFHPKTVLRDHYKTLEQWGHTPETPYDDDYIAERNKRLKDAGIDVVMGQIPHDASRKTATDDQSGYPQNHLHLGEPGQPCATCQWGVEEHPHLSTGDGVRCTTCGKDYKRHYLHDPGRYEHLKDVASWDPRMRGTTTHLFEQFGKPYDPQFDDLADQLKDLGGDDANWALDQNKEGPTKFSRKTATFNGEDCTFDHDKPPYDTPCASPGCPHRACDHPYCQEHGFPEGWHTRAEHIDPPHLDHGHEDHEEALEQWDRDRTDHFHRVHGRDERCSDLSHCPSICDHTSENCDAHHIGTPDLINSAFDESARDNGAWLLGQNPQGPTKYSLFQHFAAWKDEPCTSSACRDGAPKGFPDSERHTSGEHPEWAKRMSEAGRTDAWGIPIKQPYDGHGAWDCNNRNCAEHPQEMYEQGRGPVGMPGWLKHDTDPDKDVKREIDKHFYEQGQSEDADWLLDQNREGPTKYSTRKTAAAVFHFEPGRGHLVGVDGRPLPDDDGDAYHATRQSAAHALWAHEERTGQRHSVYFIQGSSPDETIAPASEGFFEDRAEWAKDPEAWRLAHDPHYWAGHELAKSRVNEAFGDTPAQARDLLDTNEQGPTKYSMRKRSERYIPGQHGVVHGDDPEAVHLMGSGRREDGSECGRPASGDHLDSDVDTTTCADCLTRHDLRVHGPEEAVYDTFGDQADDADWLLSQQHQGPTKYSSVKPGAVHWCNDCGRVESLRENWAANRSCPSCGSRNIGNPEDPSQSWGDEVSGRHGLEDEIRGVGGEHADWLLGMQPIGPTRYSSLTDAFRFMADNSHRLTFGDPNKLETRGRGQSYREHLQADHGYSDEDLERLMNRHWQRARDKEIDVPSGTDNLHGVVDFLEAPFKAEHDHLHSGGPYEADGHKHPNLDRMVEPSISTYPRANAADPVRGGSVDPNNPNVSDYNRLRGTHPDLPNLMKGQDPKDPSTWSNLSGCKQTYPISEEDRGDYIHAANEAAKAVEQGKISREHFESLGHLCPDCGAFKYLHAQPYRFDPERLKMTAPVQPLKYSLNSLTAHFQREAQTSGRIEGTEPAAPLRQSMNSNADRWVTCDQGHTHWGANGAAGVLIRHTDDDGTKRYLLQHRAPWVDEGGTYSVPGGALHAGESPEQGALREAQEELPHVPSGLRHVHTHTDDHGGWAYHTVVLDSPERFDAGHDDYETGEQGSHWFTPEEMQNLPLHSGFAKTWPKIQSQARRRTATWVGDHPDEPTLFWRAPKTKRWEVHIENQMPDRDLREQYGAKPSQQVILYHEDHIAPPHPNAPAGSAPRGGWRVERPSHYPGEIRFNPTAWGNVIGHVPPHVMNQVHNALAEVDRHAQNHADLFGQVAHQQDEKADEAKQDADIRWRNKMDEQFGRRPGEPRQEPPKPLSDADLYSWLYRDQKGDHTAVRLPVRQASTDPCPECGGPQDHIHLDQRSMDFYRAIADAAETASEMAQHNQKRTVNIADPHDLKAHLMEAHGYDEGDFWRTSHDQDHPALNAQGFDDADRPLSHREVRRLHDWEHGHGIENNDPDYAGGEPGHFLGDSHFHTAVRKTAAKQVGQRDVWPVRVKIKDRSTGKYTGTHVGIADYEESPDHQVSRKAWPFRLCSEHYKKLQADIARHNDEATDHPHTYEVEHDTWPLDPTDTKDISHCGACIVGSVNQAMAKRAAKKDEGPSVSGVVLKAADTGRILMLQRSLADEKDPARGTWEFPGGHHEDGDTSSLHAGIREWEEEVGQPFPKGGVVSHVWRSPNGIYQGHVVVIPEEKQVSLTDGRVVPNPDDPDGDDAEQAAWWDPEHARKNPALRKEVKSAPWDQVKKAASRRTAAEEEDGRSGFEKGLDNMLDDLGRGQGFENWNHMVRHQRDTKTMQDLMHRYEGGPQHPLHPGKFDADDYDRPGDKEGQPYYQVEDPGGSGWTARDYGGPDITLHHRATGDDEHDRIDCTDPTEPDSAGSIIHAGWKRQGFGHEELHQELHNWVYGDPKPDPRFSDDIDPDTGRGYAYAKDYEQAEPRIQRWQRQRGFKR